MQTDPLLTRFTWLRRKANFNTDGFQVGLPVFTIHGNHDDPSGADNLSAVDVLSTCKLVNYFGKTVGLCAGAFSRAQGTCLWRTCTDSGTRQSHHSPSMAIYEAQ